MLKRAIEPRLLEELDESPAVASNGLSPPDRPWRPGSPKVPRDEFFAVYIRFIGTHAEYDAIDAATV